MTPADLPSLPYEGIGIAGLLVLTFLMLTTDRLYTRGQVEKIEKAAADAVERAEHDRDEWRTESRIKDAQIAQKDEQLKHMGEVGRLVRDIMRAIQRSTREVDQ